LNENNYMGTNYNLQELQKESLLLFDHLSQELNIPLILHICSDVSKSADEEKTNQLCTQFSESVEEFMKCLSKFNCIEIKCKEEIVYRIFFYSSLIATMSYSMNDKSTRSLVVSASNIVLFLSCRLRINTQVDIDECYMGYLLRSPSVRIQKEMLTFSEIFTIEESPCNFMLSSCDNICSSFRPHPISTRIFTMGVNIIPEVRDYLVLLFFNYMKFNNKNTMVGEQSADLMSTLKYLLFDTELFYKKTIKHLEKKRDQSVDQWLCNRKGIFNFFKVINDEDYYIKRFISWCYYSTYLLIHSTDVQLHETIITKSLPQIYKRMIACPCAFEVLMTNQIIPCLKFIKQMYDKILKKYTDDEKMSSPEKKVNALEELLNVQLTHGALKCIQWWFSSKLFYEALLALLKTITKQKIKHPDGSVTTAKSCMWKEADQNPLSFLQLEMTCDMLFRFFDIMSDTIILKWCQHHTPWYSFVMKYSILIQLLSLDVTQGYGGDFGELSEFLSITSVDFLYYLYSHLVSEKCSMNLNLRRQKEEEEWILKMVILSA